MNKLDESFLTSDIQSSIKLSLIAKFLKVSLSLIIIIAYFIDVQWLNEIIIITVVLNLLLPMNFFDVFIQKLLEYNTQKIEERQLLNANEANKIFSDFQEKLEKLELEIEILTNRNR